MREVSGREADEPIELRISEALSRGEVFKEAARSSALYGGITILAGAAMVIVAGLTETPKASLSRSWKYFTAAVEAALPYLLAYLVPVIAVVAVGTFAVSAWNRWRLTRSYRVEIEDGRVRIWEVSDGEGRVAREGSAETIQKWQTLRVSDSTYEATLRAGATHEITMISDDGMFTFAEGLGEEEAKRAVEVLQQAVR